MWIRVAESCSWGRGRTDRGVSLSVNLNWDRMLLGFSIQDSVLSVHRQEVGKAQHGPCWAQQSRGGVVDARLPGKGNSKSQCARPVHLIITLI